MQLRYASKASFIECSDNLIMLSFRKMAAHRNAEVEVSFEPAIHGNPPPRPTPATVGHTHTRVLVPVKNTAQACTRLGHRPTGFTDTDSDDAIDLDGRRREGAVEATSHKQGQTGMGI